MPYSIDSPPDKIRGLSDKDKRRWIHVFNSCYEKYGDDAKCHKMAFGVTGGWSKDKGFDPCDENRDILLEIDIEKEMIERELGFEIDFYNIS
jgi:hypothetical protein